MPRQIRYIVPGIPHHAFGRGNNHQSIFFDQEDKEHFCKNLKRYSNQQRVYIGAYGLMNNHFHLLLYPKQGKGLKNFMKFIGQIHTQYINRRHKRSGKLWENRYKLNLVDPAYEWVLARYIELNPVRAKIVKNPTDYQYSSAKNHLTGTKDDIINIDIIKGKQKDYQDFVKEKTEEKEIKQIKDALQQNKAFGRESFIKDIEERFKTTFKLRQRGRPAKIK
jgi:putative transposase